MCEDEVFPKTRNLRYFVKCN